MNNQNDDNKQVTMVIFQGTNVTDQAEPRGNAYRMDTSKENYDAIRQLWNRPVVHNQKKFMINGVRTGSGVEARSSSERASDATFAVDPGADARGRDPDATNQNDLDKMFAVYEGIQ